MGRFFQDDATALITGAARGIGQAIAIRFAREGVNVIITDINAEGLEETASSIRALGGNPLCITGSLTDTQFPIQLMAGCGTRYSKLDILVNNAGVEHRASVADHSLDDWNRVLGINLTAPFLVCREALPLLDRSVAPAIVNIASTAITGFKGQVAYDSSKGGVLSMTRSMAVDLSSRGIRVNAVCPGFVETHMVIDDPQLALLSQRFCRTLPIPRPGTPEEVAAAVIWLASREASYITGQGIFVDGGWIRS